VDKILSELFGDTPAPQPPNAPATPASTAATGAGGTTREHRTDADRAARREARQRRKQEAGTHHRRKEFIDRYTTGSPSEGFSTEEAIAHLREMRDEMSPAEFRAALQQTIEHLPPEQRDEFIALMRQHTEPRSAAAGGASGGTRATADPFGGVLTSLMGSGGGGGGGMGDVLDDLAKGGLRAPTTPGQPPSEADFQALLNSPLGKAVLGGIAAYGLQDMQAEDDDRGAPETARTR
jgi:hypothetical protein